MKQEIKKNVGRIQLYLLAGLILIFFGILFLSTVFKNVSTNYTFEEQITTNKEEFNIGKLKITNHAPITAKINLKALKACDLEDRSRNLNLKYIGKNVNGYNSYNKQNIEIHGKSTETINLEVNHYRYDTYNKKENPNNNTKLDLNINIFELTKDDDQYSYCKTADKKNSIANIKVTLENSQK